MDIKEEAKEESSFLDLSSQNEREFSIKHPVKKVKIETVICSNDIKMELEDSMCPQNEEQHHLLTFNETINESEIETKVDIKAEHWWLGKEDTCIGDDIKDETCRDFYSTKAQSLYKEDVSHYTSDVFFSEESGNGISFNVNKYSPECESDRKCQTQESIAIDISSVETSDCSGTSNDGKIVSMASSSKQSKLLQLSNTSQQDINKNCKSILSYEYRNSYECDLSEKCFKYASHLEKHRLDLDIKEANKCDVRDKGFNQLSPETHKLINDANRIHKCSICNKAFTYLSHLKRHILIHEDIKPYKCNICNKAYTRLAHLKTHKLFHEGIKPHECNICNKAFAELPVLKRHKLVHEVVKPNKCNICNKTFTESSDLKRHKLIHLGIKPHKCNICNKAFTQSSTLKKHELIHEGIKPHECNICNKAFTQLSHLKTHKLIHEDIKPHKCNICNKAFTLLSTLKKHKFIHKDTLA